MASVRNAFSLLAGGGEQVVASAGSKSKKKNKKKGGAQAAAPSDAPAQPSAITLTPAAPVVVPERQVQTAKDAGQGLEAAAVAANTGERGALAQQWTEQVLQDAELFADGNNLVEFKQVLLKSRALDILLEGCLERGSTPSEAPALAQLLAAVAHPSVPPAVTQALADAVTSLGQLATTDRLAPTPAAKRSTAAALGLVRRGIPKPPPAKPAEAPAAKLKRLDGELGRQEARLSAVQQPKELCKAYTSILELLCGQLDVLRPGAAAAAPQAPELEAALRPLTELRAALSSRLQEVQAPPKPVLSIQEQVAQAEAAYKKEDATMGGRLSEVEGRIASLEAELAALKGEAGELRQRRSAAQQHHKLRVEQIRSGKADTGASAADIAAAVQGGLGALDGLTATLRGGQGAAAGAGGLAVDAAALGQQVVTSEVPVKLLGAMQQVVELNLQQLAETGSKARFYRERLDKAVKQGEQAIKLGVGDPKIFQQQKATAEKNVKEVLAAAEASAAACRAAVSAYRERLPLMLRLPSFLPPPPEYLQAMEARTAEAEQLCASILNGSYVPPAPAPTAAAAAPEPAAAAAAAAPAPAAAAPAKRVTVERVPAAAAVGAADLAAAAQPVGVGGDAHQLVDLQQRLALLEAENLRKDAQIAAMTTSISLDVPSPLVAGRTSMPPAMLSSPSNNKPIGPAAPIAPAAAPAPAPVPVTFSQAAAAAPAPQANGAARKGRPRRA